jgi:hypothetical protein
MTSGEAGGMDCEPLKAVFCGGCQKNVPLCERFFLQPLIPPFRISEFIFEKRYKTIISGNQPVIEYCF